MPIYDYRCAACGHRFEVIHGVHARGPESCPSCGEGPILKAVVAPAIHFKGSGWAKKERHAASSGRSRSGSDSASERGEKGEDGGSADKGAADGKGKAAGGTGDGAKGSSEGTSGGSSAAAATGPTGGD